MKQNDTEYECDVCIVGAGPAGALLAYLLSGHGISTILIERHDGVYKEFRGEHLNEDGEEILKRYGIFHDLEEIGLLRMDAVEYWDHGNILKTILPTAPADHVGIHVPQKHLLGLLLEKSEQSSHFTALLNTRVTELITDGNMYTGVKAMQGEAEIIINSKLVVGADGRFSTVRKLADISVETIKHGYDLLWAKIPAPLDWTPTIRIGMIGGKQLALFTQQGGFIQIGWNIEEGSFPELKKRCFTPFITQLIQAFPELSDSVASHIQSWNDFILLKVQSCRCDTWVKEGLVIIGDAAHTMSPTGAFGINSAMKDADALFQLLNTSDPQQISLAELKNFERTRRQDVEKEQEIQLEKEASFGQQFMPV